MISYTSCENKEVAKFNRQTKKIIKLYPNARFLEIQLQRQQFTRHGQHLNLVGKELIAIEMANKIKQLLTKVVTNPMV
jgi:urease accessory protein UreE